MNPELSPYLQAVANGRQICILGFGQEGRSTLQTLLACCPEANLTVHDADPAKEADIAAVAAGRRISQRLGDDYLEGLEKYDLVFKTPGISLKNLDLNVLRPKITSQTQIALALYGKQMVGVTGTKGKSTTATLTAHLLKGANPNVVLMGNMGVPFFDIAPQLNAQTLLVNELSSHQLEFVSCSPRMAVLLNIFEEHLDHYVSYAAYQDAKFNIARFQTATDYFLFQPENETLARYLKHFSPRGQTIPFGFTPRPVGVQVGEQAIDWNGQAVYPLSAPRQLKGRHNLLNIAAALGVAKLLGVDNETITKQIASFQGLPHRLEFVGQYHGVRYYNDSIATVPEAAIQAVEALSPVDTLIVGGFDRGIDYALFVDWLAQAEIGNLIFLPETGHAHYQALRNRPTVARLFQAQDLSQAVEQAQRCTPAGGLCLLSPAAASYGRFKNFAERGDVFKKLIAQNAALDR